MKSRLHKIEIRNFKAFRDFSLNLEGRHLLVYGANGAGKSSLYWALYTFLQSARKPLNSIAKYFDPAGTENLLNFHEQATATPKPGEIALTLRDVATKNDTTYRISQADHGTHNQPAILKGDLASDFITYRFFFGFSHFRNSEEFNLWPLFQKEILPFCVSTGGRVPIDLWNIIRKDNPNPNRLPGLAGSYAYDEFQAHVASFAAILPGIVDPISAEAQRFYDEHFSKGDPAKITLRLKATTLPSYDFPSRTLTIPEVRFGVQLDGKTINRPQAFLNEAKMTQLALSVRFAASRVNLHDSDLKLLVLDDLLVSLDMSNRMQVLEILLSKDFANYQKIILTHDLGFFQEIRRLIGFNHSNWLFAKITGDAKQGPRFESVKTDLELAQDHLANDQLAECGNRLRKCAEADLASFITAAKAKQNCGSLIPTDKFTSLAQKISEAKNLLALAGLKEFASLIHKQFTLDQLTTLVSPDEIDPAKFAALPKQERGKIIGKLFAARPQLQELLIGLLTDASRKHLNAINILEEVNRIKDRILNPASHAGVAPFYTKEAQDAVKVIQALEPALTAALATL